MPWCLFQESLKIVEYPLHQLICLGLLEIHVAPSNLGQQQFLTQGYCVAIVSLLLLLKTLQTLVNQSRNWVN